MGLGFPYNGSISHWLGRILQESYPDRPIESVNLAMVGYSSQQVKRLAVAALDLAEPDMIVIYSGNNEYLDTKATMALSKTPADIWQKQRTKMEQRFAVVRLLSRLDSNKKEIIVKDPEILSNYQDISLSPEQLDFSMKRYERNLSVIVKAATKQNVPVVLCSLIACPVDNFQLQLAGKWFQNEPLSLRWFRQGTGWARLGRWDKALDVMKPLYSWGPGLGLVRLDEAGGIRGMDNLNDEARVYLNQVAQTLLKEFESSDSIGFLDLYKMATCYKLLKMDDKLSALLSSLPDRFDDMNLPQKIKFRFFFSQFMDSKAYHDAYNELWKNSDGGTIATPETNRIVRKVAHETGAILADIEKTIPDWIEPSPRRFLMDYCHLNIEGNFEVAQAIFQAAKKNGALPRAPRAVDYKKTLLELDLKFLKETAHDFIDPAKWMGLYFRVCQVYCEPVSSNELLGEWFAKDAVNYPNQEVVQDFLQNAALNEIPIED